jgi:hypothetical protein
MIPPRGHLSYSLGPVIEAARAWWSLGLTKMAGVELFLRRRGFLLLAAFAVIYYAAYHGTGLALSGEQGSNALIAMRILGGERPIADIFIGYNLLWFYPLVLLFSLLGPHWLAMRIYFAVLAAAAALLGYALVRRVTGQAWLALVTGVFMVLMPGAIFRNYMGLIGVLAATVLLRGYVLDAGGPRRQITWMAAAGAGLAVCFLIRIEPSLLIAVVWACLTVFYPFGVRGAFGARLRTVLLGTVAALAAFAAVHAPFTLHAYQRGFGPQFTAQYGQFFRMLGDELRREVDHWTAKPEVTPAPLPQTANAPAASSVEAAPASGEFGGRDGRRALPSPWSIVSVDGIYFFPAAIWFPVLFAPLLVLTGVMMLFSAIVRRDPERKTLALVMLTTTGCALAFFPQYFFFRPDPTHLNEFLLVFWPASVCSAWASWRAARLSGSRLCRSVARLLICLTALQMILSFNALFNRESSGSIRSSRGMDTPFRAANGVRAKVKKKELDDWEGLRDSVVRHAGPKDFVITYPYVPIVNVMCDRPSYQWRLYADNVTVGPSFIAEEIALIDGRRPAVIVVNNRAINKTEESRFRNWAAPLQAHIDTHYAQVGVFFKDVVVYARRDRSATPVVPEGD